MNPADLLVQSDGEDKIRVGGYLLPAEDFSMTNFMRFDLGMSWLHPGGMRSTENLLAQLRLNRNMRVLDLGCGVASAARIIAKRYGCEVVAIDRDSSMIAAAAAYNRAYSDQVSLLTMDGLNMDFADNSFDCVILQSVLCFNDKQKLLQEIRRVLRPGGQIAANESTWLQPPTGKTAMVTRATICESFQNALESNQWIAILLDAGFTNVKSKTCEFTAMSPYQMLREEGLLNTIRIMSRVMLNPELNTRLRAVSSYFSIFHGFFGYGLYIGSKPKP